MTVTRPKSRRIICVGMAMVEMAPIVASGDCKVGFADDTLNKASHLRSAVSG